MKSPALVVISTAFASSTEKLCRASVERQTLAAAHLYVDASRQSPPKRCSENLVDLVRGLDPSTVCVHLDGDDWLAHSHALEDVAQRYVDPDLWMTWGSYIRSDGKAGIAAAYRDDENPREVDWRMSHLKTFRAGLAQRIRPEDLKLEGGDWTHRAVDCAFMFPMFEMAGPSHRAFVPDILAVYHFDASFERNASPSQLKEEREIAKYFQSMPPYAPLEALR